MAEPDRVVYRSTATKLVLLTSGGVVMMGLSAAVGFGAVPHAGIPS